jgi:hypothetical protein
MKKLHSMESINVRQKPQPIRYAFLIRSDDSAGLVQAVSLNTILWGGLFNAIVATPAEDRDGLLREFDPDYLVDLTGEPLPREITTAFEHRIVGPDDILRDEDPTGQHSRRLKTGIRHGSDPAVRRASVEVREFLAMPTE